MRTNLSPIRQTTKQTTNNFVKPSLTDSSHVGSLDITQVSWPTNKDKGYKHQARLERFAERTISGQILGGRQRDCGCKCIDKGGIAVMQKEGSTYLSGLSTCSSVWACPVCSNKINDVRSKEVSLVLNHYLKSGYALGMLTLTSQHNYWESCKGVKARELGSFNRMIVSRKYKDLCKFYGFEGYIRALEVTIGNNGWHPHLHIAIILNQDLIALEAFCNAVVSLWVSFNKGTTKEAQDYTPIRDTQGISKYITKWTAADELVKSNHKTSKQKSGYTPFGLLRLVKKHGWDFEIELGKEKRKVRSLFKEYAEAFKGAKQLTYSKKIQLKLKEVTTLKTDIEICKEKQEDAKPVLFLKNDLFKHIAKNNIQAYVLNILETESILELELFLMEFGLFTIYDPDKKTLLLE